MSGGGGCSSSKGGPVKIVIINTQYVETDATSFKDVVQKLTGKDSHHLPPPAERELPAVLMRDVSFKEFDRLLAQMPPFNELCSSEFC